MLFFLDIETTGLCEKQDYMLEIACVALDGPLVIDKTETLIRPANGEPWVERMDDYVLNMHTENGLLASLGERMPIKNISEAEDQILQFVTKFTDSWNSPKPILAGNSVQFDRRFIHEQMPTLDAVLHHRMFDCSTLKMFAQKNWPALVEERIAQPAHRAMADTMESIQTYQHYVTRFNPRRFGAKARRA